jgi:hypothetical protein
VTEKYLFTAAELKRRRKQALKIIEKWRNADGNSERDRTQAGPEKEKGESEKAEDSGAEEER